MRVARVAKVALVGASGAGKTSMLQRLIHSRGPGDVGFQFGATVGPCLHQMELQVPDVVGVFRLEIWDTPGQDMYGAVARNVYRGADAVLVVFDAAKHGVFAEVSRWHSEILESAAPPVIILVGNQSDRLLDDYADLIQIQEYARTQHLPIKIVSAKCNLGLDELFVELCEMIHNSPERNRHNSFKLVMPLQRTECRVQKPTISAGTLPAARSYVLLCCLCPTN